MEKKQLRMVDERTNFELALRLIKRYEHGIIPRSAAILCLTEVFLTQAGNDLTVAREFAEQYFEQNLLYRENPNG